MSTTTDEMYRACAMFLDPAGSSLWDRLSAGAGYQSRDGGHPSAKSRPPATLSVVALTIDVTTAVRESVLDLVGLPSASLRLDLSRVLGEIDSRQDLDLIEWWTTSLVVWSQRAAQLLGQSRVLLKELRGAACPYCSARVVRVRADGEDWIRPAIVVDWDSDDLTDAHSVHSLHCRACDAQWLRGVELDELIARTMRANLTLAVLTLDDEENEPDLLPLAQVEVVACEGRTGGVSPVQPSPSSQY
jgi:hypothetical protein